MRHVCETAERIKEDPVNFFTTIDWGKVATTAGNIAGELFYVNDIQRLVTGVDPITGEETNRWEATGWLALDVVSLGSSKAVKGAKVVSKVDDVADVIKGAKAVDKVDDVTDVVKVVDKADDIGNSAKIVNKTEDVSDATKVTKGEKGAGRAKNKIKPDSNATGAHSVYKRDPKTGEITNYKTYEPNPYNPSGFQEIKGYDGVGAGHTNSVTGIDILTPHVHDKNTPGGIRIPEPWEIPGK